MPDGEIFYARFPITLDSNGVPDTSPVLQIATIFPAANFDSITTKIVPISGGSGKSNAVMIVFARDIT